MFRLFPFSFPVISPLFYFSLFPSFAGNRHYDSGSVPAAFSSFRITCLCSVTRSVSLLSIPTLVHHWERFSISAQKSDLRLSNSHLDMYVLRLFTYLTVLYLGYHRGLRVVKNVLSKFFFFKFVRQGRFYSFRLRLTVLAAVVINLFKNLTYLLSCTLDTSRPLINNTLLL